ncbi:low affinity immunoglobulin epsilon Fc receptor-like [Littorina saxatilis]|uniref:low affinity immunoglobulin epsilon Fc receptor-like n=1 Tax=Littorina saxatilis TaxID=31220 RepID=UPI0038B68CA0
MLEVESKAENDFIVAQISLSGLSRVWMGINDLVREGRWVYNSNGLPLKYSNWIPGMPDNFPTTEGGEVCCLMRPNGGWNDIWCEEKHDKTTPVCEKREVHG